MVLEGKTGSSRVKTRQASGSEVGLLPEGENGDGYEAVLEPESTSRARSDSSSSDSSSDSSSSDSSVESQEEEVRFIAVEGMGEEGGRGFLFFVSCHVMSTTLSAQVQK